MHGDDHWAQNDIVYTVMTSCSSSASCTSCQYTSVSCTRWWCRNKRFIPLKSIQQATTCQTRSAALLWMPHADWHKSSMLWKRKVNPACNKVLLQQTSTASFELRNLIKHSSREIRQVNKKEQHKSWNRSQAKIEAISQTQAGIWIFCTNRS